MVYCEEGTYYVEGGLELVSFLKPHDVHQEKPSFPLRQISKSNISTTMHSYWKLPVAASVLQEEGL
jgi:hypothetical protein